jgi:hypothetical protein
MKWRCLGNEQQEYKSARMCSRTITWRIHCDTGDRQESKERHIRNANEGEAETSVKPLPPRSSVKCQWKTSHRAYKTISASSIETFPMVAKGWANGEIVILACETILEERPTTDRITWSARLG